MKVCFEDIGHMSATFAVASGEAGVPVRLSGNAAVAPCADGEVFCGVLESCRGGFGGVQLHGFVTLPYTGTAPTLGYNTLVGNGSGGVKVATGGRSLLVVSVDTGVNCVTFEL